MTRKIQAVLFDMDGVLVDSEEFICHAGIQMFKEKGYRVWEEDFLPFTGMGENRYLGGVAEKYSIPFDMVKDKQRCYEIYEEKVKGKLKALPGVFNFIRECRNRTLKTAVASSADLVKVRINLREIGLEPKTFGTLITGQDVINKKPAPDVFLKAAEKLNVDPAHCLVVEDAISGVAAGKTAGAKVLALTTSFPAEKLSAANWIACDLSGAGTKVLEW